MRGKIVFLVCAALLAVPSVICRGESSDVSALLEQAGKYADDANFAAAEALYKQIIADYPQTADGLEAQEKLTILYIEQDKSAQADAAFDEMVTVFSEFEGLAKAVDHVADAYRELKDYEQARDTYRYAVMSWPEAEHAADSQRAIALTSILLGDEPNSEAAINKLLSDFGSYPNIATVVDHLADDMRELKRYEQARRLYQHVVDNYPQADYAMNCLGGVVRTSILLNDEPNAAAGTDRLFGEFAGRAGAAKAVDNIADRYRKSARYDKARELYKRAVATWPTAKYAMESQKGYVLCSIALADEPNALAGIERLVKNYSDDRYFRGVLSDIAGEYEHWGDYLEAKGLYEQLEELAEAAGGIDGEFEAARARILVYINDGNDPAALEAIEHLMVDYNEHPALTSSVFEIAKKYYDIGRLQFNYGCKFEKGRDSPSQIEGKRQFRKTARLTERIIAKLGDRDEEAVAEVYHLAAECYRRTGKFKEARVYYQEVVDRWPDYKYAGSSQFLVGYCYKHLWNRGHMGKAEACAEIRSAYNKVLENYPECAVCRAARMWLEAHPEAKKGGAK